MSLSAPVITHIKEAGFGKKVGTDLYFHKESLQQVSSLLNHYIGDLEDTYDLPHDKYQVIKFSLVSPRVSFLEYPGFFEEPHPILISSATIDLNNEKVRKASYRKNPPILHRKETFLPKDHPAIPEYIAMTKAEEEQGLYEHPKTIGFLHNWNDLLNKKKLSYEGHKLVPLKESRMGEPKEYFPELVKEGEDLHPLVKQVLLSIQKGDFEGDDDSTVENDGIGHTEAWGVPHFDAGVDYVMGAVSVIIPIPEGQSVSDEEEIELAEEIKDHLQDEGVIGTLASDYGQGQDVEVEDVTCGFGPVSLKNPSQGYAFHIDISYSATPPEPDYDDYDDYDDRDVYDYDAAADRYFGG
jgi:hypothetical protein